MRRPKQSLGILLAPSGFKECLRVSEVVESMARGVRTVVPDAEILKAPMIDGGEGFTETLVNITGGSLHAIPVTGPVGRAVEATIGLLGRKRKPTAVIEIAAAAGLRLVPADARDPRKTTSFGVGEMIRAALDLGAKKIVVGCGDSGVNDGGAGMAEALGIRLLDRHERPIGRGGGSLSQLARIDVSARDPRLETVRIEAAVNSHNVLLGPRGVARIFGPQKGASAETVAELEAGLENFAEVVRRDLGIGVERMAGAGASGGLGAGLHAFLGARLRSRFDIVLRYVPLERLLSRADVVLTAEGSIDGQTRFGKAPAEVARRAKRRGLPVVALAGTIGPNAREAIEAGLDAIVGVLQRPCSRAEAMANASAWVADASEQAIRLILAARRKPRPRVGLTRENSHESSPKRPPSADAREGETPAPTLRDIVAGDGGCRRHARAQR